jgi:hypothetical protein
MFGNDANPSFRFLTQSKRSSEEHLLFFIFPRSNLFTKESRVGQRMEIMARDNRVGLDAGSWSRCFIPPTIWYREISGVSPAKLEAETITEQKQRQGLNGASYCLRVDNAAVAFPVPVFSFA